MLDNRVNIEVFTANHVTTRGYTFAAVLADEVAFWRSEESASPDTEILAACRPGLSSIPDSMLIALSSPYSRRGALWEAYKRHHGQDSDILVWQASTREMNPTIDQGIIDRALQADPASASAEWLASFRSDLEAFVSVDVLDACTVPGRFELPCFAQHTHHAFVDPSGGSSDSMTMAVCHGEDDRVVIDCLRERTPPLSPDDVVKEFSVLLKSYGISEIHGDRYAGEWPRERFLAHGISYVTASKPKSDLYLQLLPLLNAQRIELLDHPKTLAQLVSLERRTSRSGRDSVDHPPKAHDDLSNAIAGAASLPYLGEIIRGDFRLGVPAVSRENTPWTLPQTQRDVIGYANCVVDESDAPDPWRSSLEDAPWLIH